MSEAYIYAQTPISKNSKVKIGSHKGSVKKLWSRYGTYHGTDQLIKVIRVEPEKALIFERFIQAKLQRCGVWKEKELFDKKAWILFDRIAEQCVLEGHTVVCVKEPKKDKACIFQSIGSGINSDLVFNDAVRFKTIDG